MADLPAGIDLARHRDLKGRGFERWLARGFLFLLALFLIAGLLSFFGQSTTTSSVRSTTASLSLTAPSRIRGGLIYQATFEVHAFSALRAPTLVLDRGWYDQTTINTVEPEPAATSSDANYVTLRFPPLGAGRTLVVYINLQANPTNVGSHKAGVALYDGARHLVSLDRTQLDFP